MKLEEENGGGWIGTTALQSLILSLCPRKFGIVDYSLSSLNVICVIPLFCFQSISCHRIFHALS